MTYQQISIPKKRIVQTSKHSPTICDFQLNVDVATRINNQGTNSGCRRGLLQLIHGVPFQSLDSFFVTWQLIEIRTAWYRKANF